MKKIINFPYQPYKGEFYPIIKIRIRGPYGPADTEAYVDSGASVSIFLAKFASRMGLNFERGNLSYIMVGDGSYIPLYLHRIPIQIGHIWIHAAIGFSAHLGAEFNLLGQKNIFDRFKITFDKRKKTISFQPY